MGWGGGGKEKRGLESISSECVLSPIKGDGEGEERILKRISY